MTNKIISSENDFENIDIEIESANVTEIEDVAKLEDIPDLNTEPSKEPPKDEVKDELNKVEKSEDIELDIDDLEPSTEDVALDINDIEPEETITEEKAEVEKETVSEDDKVSTEETKAKRGRKPKEPKQSQQARNAGIYDPMFDISKIKMDKYQTRKTQRTPAQIKEFSDKIKLQGQLEPVHLVKEGEDFQLLAGFGRLEALKILKSKTIKAIVYENFSDYEIMTYSFGTNENRLELSEIDKIWSVGEFVFKHPEMLLDSTNPREKTVRNVFGYDRKDIYAFNKMYQYFSTNPAWLELFKTKTYQRYVFDKIMDNTDKIKDVEKFIAKFTELTWENNLEFNLKFNQLFQDIEKQENIDEKITEKIDELESIDDKIENLQEKKLEKKAEEIVDKLLQTDIEETRKKIHDFFDNISKELRKANNHLQKIKDIPDYQKFMQNDDVLVVNKLLDMISKTVTKLV